MTDALTIRCKLQVLVFTIFILYLSVLVTLNVLAVNLILFCRTDY